jgi:hypothetical protein
MKPVHAEENGEIMGRRVRVLLVATQNATNARVLDGERCASPVRAPLFDGES